MGCQANLGVAHRVVMHVSEVVLLAGRNPVPPWYSRGWSPTWPMPSIAFAGLALLLAVVHLALLLVCLGGLAWVFRGSGRGVGAGESTAPAEGPAESHVARLPLVPAAPAVLSVASAALYYMDVTARHVLGEVPGVAYLWADLLPWASLGFAWLSSIAFGGWVAMSAVRGNGLRRVLSAPCSTSRGGLPLIHATWLAMGGILPLVVIEVVNGLVLAPVAAVLVVLGGATIASRVLSRRSSVSPRDATGVSFADGIMSWGALQAVGQALLVALVLLAGVGGWV